jgi:serine/threonine protein kinase
VYKAVNRRTGDVVAIKIISIDATDVLDDVRKEIQILSECHHENIVNYLGSYFKDDNLWVCNWVREYCNTGTRTSMYQCCRE